jgi:hypothetical protein
MQCNSERFEAQKARKSGKRPAQRWQESTKRAAIIFTATTGSMAKKKRKLLRKPSLQQKLGKRWQEPTGRTKIISAGKCGCV